MGKDVILILIILLSYTVLTKFTDTVEGLDTPNHPWYHDFVNAIVGKICEWEDKIHDPQNYQCVSPDLDKRPEMCYDTSGREIPCKWRRRGVGESGFSPGAAEAGRRASAMRGRTRS